MNINIDKKLVANIVIPIITFLFAMASYRYFTTNIEISQTILEPALSLNNWVAGFVLAIWLIAIIFLYKRWMKPKKMVGWKKVFITFSLSIFIYWIIFIVVDILSSISEVNSIANSLLQLNVLIGLSVFGIWFVVIALFISKQTPKKKRGRPKMKGSR